MLNIENCSFWKDLKTNKILVTLPLEIFEELLEDSEPIDKEVIDAVEKYESGDKTDVVSIEKLWQIKDTFSSSCNRDIKKIIEKMDRIAKEQGFLKNVGRLDSNGYTKNGKK